MQARFLLGPAGSGKTYRCLAEIRAALKASPDGPPLILLAPKQATFQLERQLLADPELPGYTRLHIFSFERLAKFIFDQSQKPVPQLLSEEGRVMVLRALLGQRQKELKLFHASARLPGFAKQLSLLLRELQRHHWSAAKLESLAEKVSSTNRLDAKLHDLALLLRAYLDWLKQHKLEDIDRLLDLASEALKSQIVNHRSQIKPAGLWLDGFAEMTPQELALVAALVPHCEHATLAFCLETEPGDESSWLSPWTVIGQTFMRCRQAVSSLTGCQTSIQILSRDARKTRFGASFALRHLEEHWMQPKAFAVCDLRFAIDEVCDRPAGHSPEEHPTPNFQLPTPNDLTHAPELNVGCSLRLAACPNPEAEAILAAREILRHVRAGGRYREAAVLVRSLDAYADTVRRIFTRYDIPFFLDRRETVAHHPAAELTRYALRTAAFGWRQEDWFGALKTGLVPARDGDIDWLENVALEFGWEGTAWLQPLHVPENVTQSERAERLRQKLVPPFASLAQQTAAPLDGPRLAAALRDFWDELEVERTLEEWSVDPLEAESRFALVPPTRTPGPESRTKDEGHGRARFDAPRSSPLAPSIHATVWDQIHAWFDDLEIAFAGDVMPLRDWLPVLEAGLSTLTVGVIPPALDQVLIGAVDRSRNPDLKLALVLGLNEGVFPAPPAPDPLLLEHERETLALHGADLGPSVRHRLGHERYLGYIACTRAREWLVLTCADFDAHGKKLNRSLFFDHVQRLFPELKIETWRPRPGFNNAEHLTEIIPLAIQLQASLRTPDTEVSAATEHPKPILSTPSEGEEGQGEEVRKRSWRARQAQLDLFTSEEQGTDSPVRTLQRGPELLQFPELVDVLAKARQVAAAAANQRLSSAATASLYGHELSTSVSALEDFAACPFKFFIGRGLRAEERMRFELDPRERGSFQHEVLTAFHNELAAAGRKWRHVLPAEAREHVRRIGRELLPRYRHGLFTGDAARRFVGDLLLESLETVIEVLIGWAKDYRFDPEWVEAGFGLPSASWPAWRVELSDGNALLLRGRIDRVDVWRDPLTGAAVVVVMDYKSSSRKPDRVKLYHGLQLQLPTYVAALEQLPEARATFGAGRIVPAGVFYVNLRGEFHSVKSRVEALEDPALALRKAFLHTGRFDESFLSQFDPREAGEQFNITKRGQTRMNSVAFRELLSRATENLRRFGRGIFSGEIAPAPYRKGQEIACDHCDYASVCRFDRWIQSFRTLAEPSETLVTPDEQRATESNDATRLSADSSGKRSLPTSSDTLVFSSGAPE